MGNVLKTGLLMAAIMALFGAVGAAVGGAQGMLLALALGAGMNFFAYRELRGVMAHELAHVKHRDILTSTITASVAGAISTLANFGMLFGGRDDNRNPVFALLILILAPIAAMLIQFAISRSRGFSRLPDALGRNAA